MVHHKPELAAHLVKHHYIKHHLNLFQALMTLYKKPPAAQV